MIAPNEQRNKPEYKDLYKGAYVKYPFENGLYELPVEDRFVCINGFIQTLVAIERGEIPPPLNFQEWTLLYVRPGHCRMLHGAVYEKIWKYPTEKMSLHWVNGRIPRPPVEDIIKSAIGIETEGYTHAGGFLVPA